MISDKYRVHKLVQYDYSEIVQYVDESDTDKPLRNDEIVDLLNNLEKENKELRAKVDDKEVAVEVETEILMEKILKIIDNKISILEHDLNRAVKAGASTTILYDEIDLLSELKKEMQE